MLGSLLLLFSYFPFILTFAGRMVECSSLKRAVEIVYAATLPKASKPFVYMSIILPPEHVDVNVHPTKKEVNFFLEDILSSLFLLAGISFG